MTSPLDNGSTIGAPPTVILEPAASPVGADTPPPPPPAPSGPPSKQTLKAQKKRLDQQYRSTTLQGWWRVLRAVPRAWWFFFGGIVALFAFAQFAQWFTASMVRAATPESQTAAVVETPTSVVYRSSFPNPLKQVKLTPEAAVILGARDSDGDGKMDALDDVRSSAAVVAILKANDLCGWFVTVDSEFKPVLSQTATPGAAKLATCAAPLTTTTTAAPTVTTAAAK